MQETSKLIFLVDDDKVIINLLEYVFQGKNGYNIKSFLSGEECISNMHMNPDIVVLDYILNASDLNALNGLETLEKIKKTNPDVSVIILSGRTDEQINKEMIKYGAKKILSKDDFFVDKLDSFIASEIK